MQKYNVRSSELLVIFALIKVWIFWGISINFDYLQFPLTETSLLTRLYQPRMIRSGGSR